jgi:hypothetical protein
VNIKKTHINESAGISEVVRSWASIIKKIIEDKTKPTTKQINYDYGYDYDDYRGDYTPLDYDAPYSHFEYDTEPYETIDTAYILGDDIKISSYLKSLYPTIKSEAENTLFKVTIQNGDFIVSVVNTDKQFIDEDTFLELIEESLYDHAFDEQPFYDLSHDFLFATQTHQTQQLKMFDKQNRIYDVVDEIIIEGKDYPEVYEKFSVDKWVLTSSNRIEYDHWKSGYNENKEYVVYLNIPIYGTGLNALIHEIKHAYDDYNRIIKGRPPIRDSWEIKNIYTKDFEELIMGGKNKYDNRISAIIKNYYLGSKLETPAYLENQLDSPNIVKYLETSKEMMNFNLKPFLTEDGDIIPKLQDEWLELIKNYNIPLFRTYPDFGKFLEFTKKYFNKRGLDIFKRINKMTYVHKKNHP